MKFFGLSFCIIIICNCEFVRAQQNGSLFLSSLSYDIMKAYAGESRVKNEFSAGTAFTIHLSVKDNENSIPQKIMDKIFQPFFQANGTGNWFRLIIKL